jgi:hypothetical protein
VIRVSTGTSFAFETGMPRILARDFSPGGTVDISDKHQELETAPSSRCSSGWPASR